MSNYQSPNGSHHLTNTHTYDGKLLNTIQNLNLNRLDNETKKRSFIELNKKVGESRCDHITKICARQTIGLILNSIQQPGNYDNTNNVYADDLLMYLCTLNLNDMIDIITEQLADVVISGRCPQGRCTRLIQLCLAAQDK